ncbi:glucose 1-dehydrogenase [Terrarubrum flagellatum]|uniref:SDR family NAD(P)-dependent oxidoreductase n=1 Tax=Terrirubrum flagellatum TaxID=2895980 RepID=UPI00314565D8
MNRLAGKVAIVTGATGGIGREAAILFAREGARVVVAGRRISEGEETLSLLKAAGGEGIFVSTDVTEPDSVAEMIARTIEAFGKLDVIYNNAGGSTSRDGPVTEAPLDEFWRAIKLDLFGTWLCCRAAIPEMIKAGGGSIVNSASIVAMMGIPRRDAYTASKGGVIALGRSMAVEYASHRIRVNTVVPGAVATERVMKFYETEPHLKKQWDAYLLGISDPIDVAQAALFLASDESRKTTGQVLTVDGGILIS